VQNRVTPLLEIVEHKKGTLAAHLDNAFAGLKHSLAGFQGCFLDCREIVSDGENAAFDVFARAEKTNLPFIPVTGISRNVDVAAALAHRSRGLALRTSRAELQNGGIGTKLQRFLSQNRLSPADVDLVVDLGPLDGLVQAGVERLITKFLAAIPTHDAWRTLVLSSAAAPSSTAGIRADSHDLTPRIDWLAWRAVLYDKRDSLIRLPIYSDATIQHPKGVEGIDFRVVKPSAAIRYTTESDWLCIKGRSSKVTPHKVQFPKLAEKLSHGTLKQFFRGHRHCLGCGHCTATANGAPRHHSLEEWKRIGIIHHITTVVEQLEALADA
jgi:hypothetical protein